jgi:hypothetical protein
MKTSGERKKKDRNSIHAKKMSVRSLLGNVGPGDKGSLGDPRPHPP